MTLIVGRYELGERLGTGGMSTVRVAYDRRLEREVAIKLLAEHLAADEQFVTRFKREALAAARLVHPNIVQVFDFGYDDDTRNHFIVMERIVGPSGAVALRERRQLSADEAVHWIEQSCRGLQHAHNHGVVHRDVKPGNLLLSHADGSVKLADFGIAKAMSDVSEITKVGSVLGTASYLSPEQTVGEPATQASDLYGLGVVAYQLLSGRLPYDATSLSELAEQQQQYRPIPLDQLDGRIPPALADAVERALELEPYDRFTSADQMRAAIVAAIGVTADGATAATRIIAAEPQTAATRVQPAAARTTLADDDRQPQPTTGGEARRGAQTSTAKKRRRLPLAPIVFTLALAVVAAAIAYWTLTQRSTPPQLQDVTRDTTREVIDALRQMITDNTR